MTTIEPGTLNNAARVLGEVAPDLPADAALRRFFATHRRLGPRERRAVSRAVFVYFRWLNWLDPRESRQRQLAQAWEWQQRFDAKPAAIKPEALAARAVPAWLAGEMEITPEFLRALQRDPVLWLRARPGQAGPLARRLGDAQVFAPAPPGAAAAAPLPEGAAWDAVRYDGAADLFLTGAFHAGDFEIQDLASQWVGLCAAPRPGETWWDRTAGEGGKTLHLADLMQNRGVVWATDRSERRLATLQRRASRAKLFNIRIADKAPRGAIFDGILVDAPCSGVGTWQRNPHARWTTTAADVAELASVQQSLLAEVAPRVKPGGRLVYAVCTLTRRETAAVADAFGAAHPEFERLAAGGLLLPQTLGSNGMFVAAWRRR